MYQPPVYSPLNPGDVLRAGGTTLFGSAGAALRSLRTLLADEFDAAEVATCRSGTQALELAIRVAREALDDPHALAALPAYTCFDVATAAIGAGGPVTFYDLEGETLNPEWQSLGRTIDEGAKVLVVSSLYGYPVDWERLAALAGPQGVVLVEDAAQAVGARWGHRASGSLGDLSVLSFGRGKGWTGGAGGALLARHGFESALHVLDVSARPRGRDSAEAAVKCIMQWTFGRPGLYGVPARLPWLGLGETHYRPPQPLAPMSSFSAALIARTRGSAERERARRLTVAAWLTERIEPFCGPESGISLLRPLEHAYPSYLRFPVLARSRPAEDSLPRRARRLGIASGYPSTLPDLPEIRPLLHQPPGEHTGPGYPGAERLVRDLIALPTHRFISERRADAAVRCLTDLVGKAL